jgi:hypothetical protein
MARVAYAVRSTPSESDNAGGLTGRVTGYTAEPANMAAGDFKLGGPELPDGGGNSEWTSVAPPLTIREPYRR